MIPKPIQQIVLADLQAMVGVVRESKTIEFKSEMPGRRDSDTVPFLAGISSLANTVGGDFILGVVANDGLAESVPGMELSSLDAEQQRLEQLLASGVEPRLPRVDIHPVECGEGRFVESRRPRANADGSAVGRGPEPVSECRLTLVSRSPRR